MSNLHDLTEKRATLLDEAEAISAVALEENRELTEKEESRIDAILGSGKPGDDGYKPGEVDRVDVDISRAQRIEELQAAKAASRGIVSTPTLQNSTTVIPVNGRYQHRQMRAFRGENAEYNAYASGQWIRAVFYGSDTATRWCKDHGIPIRSQLAGNENSAGGYLVPEEMERAIITLREERGVFRQYARIMPMGSDTVSVPRRSGGLTGYWTTDNQSITASEKTWDNVTLVAKKLGALVKYSSELAEDAVVSIADDLSSEIAYTFANSEDSAGFLGDGTSTYGGIKGLITAILDGSTVTAATGNTAFSTLDLDDFENMVGKLPQYPGMQPRWFIHKAGWAASMLRLQAAAGGNTINTLGAGPDSMQFLGYPVVWSQVMNSTLTAQTSQDGLCYFGDLSTAAMLGSRRGVSLMVSTDRYFELDQLAIKGTERLDIKVHETGTASAAGAMIMLATPAS